MDWFLLLPLLPRPLFLVPRPLAVPTPHLKDPGTPFSINLWVPFIVCFILCFCLVNDRLCNCLFCSNSLFIIVQSVVYGNLWNGLIVCSCFGPICCSQCESLATHLPWLLRSELLIVMSTCYDNVFICRSALAAAILSSSLTGQMWAIPPTRLRSFSVSSQSDIFSTEPNRGAGIHTR